ncbi:hypothetical protein D3C80_1582940 [compost metagenome]
MLNAIAFRETNSALGEVIVIVCVIVGAGGHDQHATLFEQRLTGQRFEFPPDTMRVAHDRQILGTLADREAGDPCIAVA